MLPPSRPISPGFPPKNSQPEPCFPPETKEAGLHGCRAQLLGAQRPCGQADGSTPTLCPTTRPLSFGSPSSPLLRYDDDYICCGWVPIPSIQTQSSLLVQHRNTAEICIGIMYTATLLNCLLVLMGFFFFLVGSLPCHLQIGPLSASEGLWDYMGLLT